MFLTSMLSTNATFASCWCLRMRARFYGTWPSLSQTRAIILLYDNKNITLIVIINRHIVVFVIIYASAAARWRGCVYVLQSVFFVFFVVAFCPSATTIVHKYETTVLRNGWRDFHETFTKRAGGKWSQRRTQMGANLLATSWKPGLPTRVAN